MNIKNIDELTKRAVEKSAKKLEAEGKHAMAAKRRAGLKTEIANNKKMLAELNRKK